MPNLDSLYLTAARVNNDGEVVANGGQVMLRLWAICPWCGGDNPIAVWNDGGFVQGGSISCNHEGCDCPDVFVGLYEVEQAVSDAGDGEGSDLALDTDTQEK